MKGKAKQRSTNELQLELKYCERCGGLWLRPVGGGQIYCASCSREMAQLPPPSKDRETAQLSQGPRWGMDEDDADVERDEDLDLDAAGGLA
jgi:Zn-finger nucleic acid-binding protein